MLFSYRCSDFTEELGKNSASRISPQDVVRLASENPVPEAKYVLFSVSKKFLQGSSSFDLK